MVPLCKHPSYSGLFGFIRQTSVHPLVKSMFNSLTIPFGPNDTTINDFLVLLRFEMNHFHITRYRLLHPHLKATSQCISTPTSTNFLHERRFCHCLMFFLSIPSMDGFELLHGLTYGMMSQHTHECDHDRGLTLKLCFMGYGAGTMMIPSSKGSIQHDFGHAIKNPLQDHRFVLSFRLVVHLDVVGHDRRLFPSGQRSMLQSV